VSTVHSGRTSGAPALTATVAIPAVSPSFDERWEAWQAKGAAHDRAVRRKLAIAAPLVVVMALVGFSALVIR
jgi:hypothetical protein